MNSTAFQYTCRFFRFRKLVLCFAVCVILLIYISFSNKIAQHQFVTKNTALQTLQNIPRKAASSVLKLVGTTEMPFTRKLDKNSKSKTAHAYAKPTQAFGIEKKLQTQTPSGITTSYVSVETFLNTSGIRNENLERKINDEVMLSDVQNKIAKSTKRKRRPLYDGPYHGIDLMAQVSVFYRYCTRKDFKNAKK